MFTTAKLLAEKGWMMQSISTHFHPRGLLQELTS
jgi:hypothetical protein